MKKKKLYFLVISSLIVTSVGSVFAGLYPDVKYTGYLDYTSNPQFLDNEETEELYNNALKNFPTYIRYKILGSDFFFTKDSVDNYSSGSGFADSAAGFFTPKGKAIFVSEDNMNDEHVLYHELGHAVDYEYDTIDNLLKIDTSTFGKKSGNKLYSSTDKFKKIFDEDKYTKDDIAFSIGYSERIEDGGELEESFNEYLKNKKKCNDDLEAFLDGKLDKELVNEYVLSRNTLINSSYMEYFRKSTNSDSYQRTGEFFAEMFSYYSMPKYKKFMKEISPNLYNYYKKIFDIEVTIPKEISRDTFFDFADIFIKAGDTDSLNTLITQDKYKKDDNFLLRDDEKSKELLNKLNGIYGEGTINTYYKDNVIQSFDEFRESNPEYNNNPETNIDNQENNAEQGTKQEGQEKVVDPDFEGVFGWVQKNGVWYFVEEDGTVRTSTLDENGQHYEFGEDGALKTGWIQTNGTWSYYNENGIAVTGWYKDAVGNWYYLDNSGVMKTGWVQTNNYWYYLNADGAMKTGWLNDNGKWYYLKPSGAMATGWLEDKDGKWYYLYGNGQMAYNTTINGYKLGPDGAWIK